MFSDIQSELELFFNNLNWTYILLFVFILYGIKHKDEFIWYNNLFNSKNWKYFKIWMSGIILMTIFIIFRSIGEDSLDSEYISQILRSWMVTIIFNTVLTKKISEIDK